MDKRKSPEPFDPERERWLNEWIEIPEGAKIRKVSPNKYAEDAEADGALVRFGPRIRRTRRRYAFGV